MATYHEISNTHQTNTQSLQSLTQYPTSQPLTITTTEAVRARVGLSSRGQDNDFSGQMHDVE